MNTLFLARRGVQGPVRVVEGPFGLDNLLHMRLRVDWDHEGYEGAFRSADTRQAPTRAQGSADHDRGTTVRSEDSKGS